MPREFSRGNRIADLIQRELSAIIHREMKDPGLGLMTINEVKVSRDLAFADIYFTSLAGTEGASGAEAEAVLQHAHGFLRTALSKVLSTRKTPRLRFHYDETIEKAARITAAIDAAVAEDEARHPGDDK